MHYPMSAVLFDLDNTLTDRDAGFAGWAAWFARQRLGLRETDAVNEAIAILVDLDAGGYTPREVLFRAVAGRYPVLTDDPADLAVAYRGENLTHLPPLDAGTTALLAALDAAGLPWGIVTNGSSDSQRAKIRKIELEHRASCILISEEVGHSKPDSEIFRAAASRLGVAARRILFVGDHAENDVAGAAQAGMRTAWLHRGRPWPDHLAPIIPDVVIGSLAELSPALLRGQ